MRTYLCLLLSSLSCCCSFWGSTVLAQVAADGTLPRPSSVETDNKLDFAITGGTQVGSNLFHSFNSFSVPTGGSASFAHSPHITYIFSRVTGPFSSYIDGRLSSGGTASLFLLNPNGIVFGPQAQLDINGSFLASTASHLLFADGTQFAATAGDGGPLLTVSVPVGLQFGSTAAPIHIQGSQLAGKQGQILAFLGGKVTVEGGSIGVEGGRVEIGSAASQSRVRLLPNARGWELDYSGVENFQDITMSGGATIDVSDRYIFSGLPEIGSGDVHIQGKNIRLVQGSQISSDNGGLISAGSIILTASESVELIGESADGFSTNLSTTTVNDGKAGDISIVSKRLSIRDGASIFTRAESVNQFLPILPASPQGDGGSLTIQASESVEIAGSSSKVGNSSLRVTTSTAGNAGNISIQTGQLILRDGGVITTETTGLGRGGMIGIQASQSIEISGRGTRVEILGVDDTGNLIRRQSMVPSGLTATAGGRGSGGKLSLKTQQLAIDNGAVISVSSSAEGNGGSIEVDAPAIILDSQGKLTAETTATSTGAGGNIWLNSEGLAVVNGSAISVSSLNPENVKDAGNLDLETGTLLLENGGRIAAETELGQGGNINLLVRDQLLLRYGGLISTRAGQAGGGGNGGNINITAPFIVAVPSENSDIAANAFTGNGGNVALTTQAIFGIEPRQRLSLLSDIVASSEFGTSGLIAITRPDVDPQSSLLQVSVEVTDPEKLAIETCGPRGVYGKGKFVITGRGGLPADPVEKFESYSGLVDLGDLQNYEQGSPQPEKSSPGGDRSLVEPVPDLVEARGWIRDARGKVVLIAGGPVSPSQLPNCQLDFRGDY